VSERPSSLPQVDGVVARMVRVRSSNLVRGRAQLRRDSAVHVDRLADDVAGFVRRQEGDNQVRLDRENALAMA
jgi:hypothetical protein